jgi:hypothetical protein
MTDDDRIPDTDPAPATAPDHAVPEPSQQQILDRVEALYALAAQILGELRPIKARLGAIDDQLGHLIANDQLIRNESQRHASELEGLRRHLPCLGGGNGGVPSGCPEAAE